MKQTALATTALVLGLATGRTGESPHVPSTTPPAVSGSEHGMSAEVDWHMGAPSGAEPMRARGRLVPVAASWVPGASRLQITVWGSGSCPAVGSGALISEDGSTVRLSLRSYPADQPCTADVRPATSVVTVPPPAALAKRTKVVVADSAGNRWSISVKR